MLIAREYNDTLAYERANDYRRQMWESLLHECTSLVYFGKFSLSDIDCLVPVERAKYLELVQNLYKADEGGIMNSLKTLFGGTKR